MRFRNFFRCRVVELLGRARDFVESLFQLQHYAYGVRAISEEKKRPPTKLSIPNQCHTRWGTRTRLGIATTLLAVASRRRNTSAQQDHGSRSTLVKLPSSERCVPSQPFTAPASIPDCSAPPPGKVTSSEYTHPRKLTCTIPT